jgi:predicted aminopeptidase
MIEQRQGDLPLFFEDVKALAKKPKLERDRALAVLLSL